MKQAPQRVGDGAATLSTEGYLAPITPDIEMEGGGATAEDKVTGNAIAVQAGSGHMSPEHSRAGDERDYVTSRWCGNIRGLLTAFLVSQTSNVLG